MLKNKKIVHISPVFQKKHQYNFVGLLNGGGGRFVSELALSISKHQDTTLITFGESDYEFKYQTLTIRIVKCAPFLRKINGDANFICFRLFNILRNFDIIHAYQYYADTTFIACLVKFLAKKKVFVTDLGYRGINLSRYVPMKYLCDKVFVLTNYDKNRLRLNNNKYEVIYGGVDLKKYKYTVNKKRKVIFIGRLLPHKGINYLIDALDDNTECIIAGHKYDKKYFDFLEKKAANKNIKFLLSASDNEIIKNLEESSVLVLPSVDIDIYGNKHNNSELFGLVIAEAFACGTPAIVSDSSALPYVVDNGINGFVIPQNDSIAIREKINYLLNNLGKTVEMGKNGRDKVEKLYNWENVAKLCIKNYFN